MGLSDLAERLEYATEVHDVLLDEAEVIRTAGRRLTPYELGCLSRSWIRTSAIRTWLANRRTFSEPAIESSRAGTTCCPIGFRSMRSVNGSILLETEGGPATTKETDLVIFHPHYPEKLRTKESVLASGVAAAFSSKRTIDRGRDRRGLRRCCNISSGDEDPRRNAAAPPGAAGVLRPPGRVARLEDCGRSKGQDQNDRRRVR